MKKLIVITLFLISINSFAQNKTTSNNYYVVLYTIGETWDTTKHYHEQKYFNEHSAHMSSLRKNKTITIGARYGNTGMIVIEAKDESAAKALVNKDIAIQNKLFKAEVFLFEPFYGGCVKETP
ncbi:MAG: hypothetical protein K0S32_106 [Bacteroidetes bacterium]|jgi:hypothetical protein|nr:hypothetical protein [Bacteroidota bacterium]